MKLRIALIIFCLTVLAANAQPERILHFESRIVVQTNGALTVTETIQAQASGDQIKHGIYRDFPQLYKGKWGLRMKTSFEIKEVLRDGQSEPYHTENRENGIRVYIGSPSSLVSTGVHTYQLTYETDRQLGFFSDHDELYWNATGNGWNFTIDSATTTVILPPGATAKNLKAYTGPQGATDGNYTATNVNGNTHFETTRQLFPNWGLTIVVEWPKGFVTESSPAAKWLDLLKDNLGLMLGLGGLLLTFIYYFVAWEKVGKDPKRGVIIPLFAPPESFSPAAVRYLKHMGFDNRAFAAAILNLAVKGKIKIDEEKHILQKRIYTLIPVRTELSGLSAEETTLWHNLVGGYLPLALKQENYATVQAAQKNLKSQLESAMKGTLFATHWRWCVPGIILSAVALAVSLLDARDWKAACFLTLWLSIWIPVTAVLLRNNLLFGIIFSVAAIGALFGFVQVTSFWIAGLIVAAGLLNVIFYYLLKAPTREGQRILDQIEGFKMYLGVAEKDRLNLENPPERTPALFEKFLPYALALGVEQKWSEQFAAVLSAAGHAGGAYSPGWYYGPSWNHLGPASFASSFGSSLAGAISSSSTAPGSSGGGGGGSSGGGGGGGGGGGW